MNPTPRHLAAGRPPAAALPTHPPPSVRPVRGRARRWGGAGIALAVAALGVAVGVVAVETARTVRGGESAQDALTQGLADRFEAVPLLTDAEGVALRRSLNARHTQLARELGVSPPATRAARDSAAAGLIGIADHEAFNVAPATYSVAALTADGAAALDSVGAAFRHATRAAGLPDARPTVTSVFRSAEDQAGLRAVNANAAGGTSSHEYATTFDLAYRRYAVAPPPAPAVRWTQWTPRPLRPAAEAALDARWAGTVAQTAAEYPARYDALLGRALVALEDRGVLVALRERRQPVYHVTVARRLAAGPPGAP